MTTVLDRARFAAKTPDLVRIDRAMAGAETLEGFLVGVTDELLLLHLLTDRIDLDGYAAVRIADVVSIESDFPRKAFYLAGLRLKGITPIRPTGLDLSDIEAFVRSVQAQFPLLVIERERISPGECEIGRIKLTSGNTYALSWLSPGATWEDDLRHFKYSDITRIDFGGEYVRTLALVADMNGNRQSEMNCPNENG